MEFLEGIITMIQVSYQVRNENLQLVNHSKLFSTMKEVIAFLKSVKELQPVGKPLIEEAIFVSS